MRTAFRTASALVAVTAFAWDNPPSARAEAPAEEVLPRDKFRPNGLFVRDVEIGQVGAFTGGGPKLGTHIRVQAVINRNLMRVTNDRDPDVSFLVAVPTAGMVTEKVIDPDDYFKPNLFKVDRTMKHLGTTYYVLVQFKGRIEEAPKPAEVVKPRPKKEPPPKVEAKKDEPLGFIAALSQVATLKGKRAKISGIVSSWEPSGAGLTLVFRQLGDTVCEMSISEAERKKLPAALPPSKWRVTVDAKVEGRVSGRLELSDVKIIKYGE